MKSFSTPISCILTNLNRWTFTGFFLLVVLAFFPIGAWTQSYEPVNVNEFNYTVDAPNVILAQGQTAEVVVRIGKVDADVQDVVGFELTFELSNDAVKLSTLAPNMTESWVKQSGVSVAETRSGAASELYTYAYGRSFEVDGNGEFLRLRVEAAHDGVNAKDLVRLAGGVLVVDNLDFRAIAPDLLPAIQVWPNPSNGRCFVRTQGADPASVKVMNLQGQVLQTYGEVSEIDLSGLVGGIYLVQAVDGDRNVVTSRIEKL